MAPIKFEEDIKDKLEKRTLTPSVDSWSKLSERLDTDEKKLRKPVFWWLGIAAGLILMVAITVQFFNKGKDIEVVPPVMVEEQLEEELLKDTEEKQNDIKPLELAIEEGTSNGNEPVSKTPEIITLGKTAKKNPNTEIELAENRNSKIEDGAIAQNEKRNEESQDLINEPLMKEAIANTLKALKSENTDVSDREIDSLLKLASKELFKEKLQDDASKTVDANALLMSVEDEMGQSFRTKVFEALKESYETVRTAVAERNN